MSNIKVIKFGGTSLASLDLIQKCAERTLEHLPAIVVVSAMGQMTNELQEKIDYFKVNDRVIHDFTLSVGEQLSAGLFAAALEKIGRNAWPMCGWQLPIRTKEKKILSISIDKILDLVSSDYVPVITGFQGLDPDGTISTLSRGGSDVTAAAIAAAIQTDCYIYTDVDGIYEIDPRLPASKNEKFSEISYDKMLEMSLSGAKVLHPDAVSIAKENSIKIYVKSSFNRDCGTIVHRSLAR